MKSTSGNSMAAEMSPPPEIVFNSPPSSVDGDYDEEATMTTFVLSDQEKAALARDNAAFEAEATQKLPGVIHQPERGEEFQRRTNNKGRDQHQREESEGDAGRHAKIEAVAEERGDERKRSRDRRLAWFGGVSFAVVLVIGIALGIVLSRRNKSPSAQVPAPAPTLFQTLSPTFHDTFAPIAPALSPAMAPSAPFSTSSPAPTTFFTSFSTPFPTTNSTLFST